MAKEWANRCLPNESATQTFCVLAVFDEDIVVGCPHCVATCCMLVSTGSNTEGPAFREVDNYHACRHFYLVICWVFLASIPIPCQNYNILVSWQYHSPCLVCPPVRYIDKRYLILCSCIEQSWISYWTLMKWQKEAFDLRMIEAFYRWGFWTGWIHCTIYSTAAIINIPWMVTDWSSPQLLQHCSV